ncbi:MAG: AgmX/PglI C-terminal domain-containing protein [Polyangiaceae bacterium]
MSEGARPPRGLRGGILRGAVVLALGCASLGCKDAPKRSSIEDDAPARSASERAEGSVETAERLADRGDFIAAHEALKLLPPTSEELDDPSVSRIESAWASEMLERAKGLRAPEERRTILEEIASAPRVDVRTRELAIRALTEPDGAAEPAPPPPPELPPPIAGGRAVPNASAVVAGLAARFRRCYKDALQLDPAAAGKIRLTTKLGPSGDVVSVTPATTGSLPASAVDCVKRAIEGAHFDAPAGGSATIVVPVTFAAQP